MISKFKIFLFIFILIFNGLIAADISTGIITTFNLDEYVGETFQIPFVIEGFEQSWNVNSCTFQMNYNPDVIEYRGVYYSDFNNFTILDSIPGILIFTAHESQTQLYKEEFLRLNFIASTPGIHLLDIENGALNSIPVSTQDMNLSINPVPPITDFEVQTENYEFDLAGGNYHYLAVDGSQIFSNWDIFTYEFDLIYDSTKVKVNYIYPASELAEFGYCNYDASTQGNIHVTIGINDEIGSISIEEHDKLFEMELEAMQIGTAQIDIQNFQLGSHLVDVSNPITINFQNSSNSSIVEHYSVGNIKTLLPNGIDENYQIYADISITENVRVSDLDSAWVVTPNGISLPITLASNSAHIEIYNSDNEDNTYFGDYEFHINKLDGTEFVFSYQLSSFVDYVEYLAPNQIDFKFGETTFKWNKVNNAEYYSINFQNISQNNNFNEAINDTSFTVYFGEDFRGDLINWSVHAHNGNNLGVNSAINQLVIDENESNPQIQSHQMITTLFDFAEHNTISREVEFKAQVLDPQGYSNIEKVTFHNSTMQFEVDLELLTSGEYQTTVEDFNANLVEGFWYIKVIDYDGNSDSLSINSPDFVESPNFISPSNNSQIPNYPINFSWSHSDQSSTIEFQLLDSNNNELLTSILEPGSSSFTLDDNRAANINLQENEVYLWNLTFIDQNDNRNSSIGNRFKFGSPGKIYVDQNVIESGIGTMSSPFKSISEAIDNAFDADSIMIATGEYIENNVVFEKNLFISGGWNSENWEDKSGVTNVKADNSDLPVFNLENSQVYFDHLSITDNILLETPLIDATGGFIIVYDCLIENNHLTGLSQNQGLILLENVEANIVNSTILGNNVNTSLITSDLNGVSVNNTLIAKNQCLAVYIADDENITFVNTTIANNNGYCWIAPNSTINLTNSIVWGNENAGLSYQQISQFSCLDFGEPSYSDISSNPLFINSEINDYSLQASSPLINKGSPQVNEGYSQQDLAGNQRIFGGRIDIGAYENQTISIPENDIAVLDITSGSSVLIFGEETPFIIRFFNEGSLDNENVTVEYFIDDQFTSESSFAIQALSLYESYQYLPMIPGIHEVKAVINSDDENIENNTLIRQFTVLPQGTRIYDGQSIYGTWDLAGSPYIIEGSATVPATQSLSIAPGVTVILNGFDPNYTYDEVNLVGNIDVFGAINAIGTESDSIRFISSDENRNWGYIRFMNSSENSSNFMHCMFVKGGKVQNNELNKATLIVENGELNLQKSLIAGSASDGISMKNDTSTLHTFSQVQIGLNSGRAINIEENSSLALSQSLISSNIQGMNIENSGSIYISQSQFSDNGNDYIDGGAISSVNSANFVIEGSVFENNTGHVGGALYLKNNGISLITHSTFKENQASVTGGAISLDEQNSEIKNNLIVENLSGQGAAAIDLYNANVSLINNTIYGNNGGTTGVLHISNDLLVSVGIINNIMNNNSGEIANIVYAEDFLNLSLQNNNYESIPNNFSVNSTFVRENNVFADPFLIDPENGNYDIDDFSICINAGNPEFGYDQDRPYDLAGRLRIYGSTIDIGAYEHQNTDVALMNPIPDQIMHEDQVGYTINLANVFVDADGDEIYYEFLSSDERLSLSFSNNLLLLTPAENWFGTSEIIILATDQSGEVASNRRNEVISDTVLVTVLPVNDEPEVIGEIPNQSLNEDFGQYIISNLLDTLFIDPDNELIFTVESSKPNVLLATIIENQVVLNSVQDMSDPNVSITVQAIEQNFDGFNVSRNSRSRNSRSVAEITFNVAIEQTPDNPQVTQILEEISFYEDTNSGVFNLLNYFTDADVAFGDSLNFDILNVENIIINQNNNLISFSAPENWFGTEEVIIQARDLLGQVASQQVLIEVIAVNDDPNFTLPDSGFVFNEDSSLNVDFTQYISEIELTGLTLNISGNSNVLYVISSLDSVDFSALPNWAGSELLTFNLMRGLILEASSESVVRVENVNDAPFALVEIPPVVYVEEDQVYEGVDVSEYFTDYDLPYGDILFYNVESGDHIDATLNGSILSVVPEKDWYGETFASLIVSDTGGLADTIDVTIVYTPVIDYAEPGFPFNQFLDVRPDAELHWTLPDETQYQVQLRMGFSPNNMQVIYDGVPINMWQPGWMGFDQTIYFQVVCYWEEEDIPQNTLLAPVWSYHTGTLRPAQFPEPFNGQNGVAVNAVLHWQNDNTSLIPDGFKISLVNITTNDTLMDNVDILNVNQFDANDFGFPYMFNEQYRWRITPYLGEYDAEGMLWWNFFAEQGELIEPGNISDGVFRGNNYLPEGDTLQINDRATLLFAEDASITIYGTLLGENTIMQPEGRSLWKGIRFLNTADGSNLRNCHFINAVHGVDVGSTSPLIDNCKIELSSPLVENSRGLFVRGNASPNLNNMEIVDYETAIKMSSPHLNQRGTPTLTNIRIRNSSQNQTRSSDIGIFIDGFIQPVIDSVYIDDYNTGITIHGRNGNQRTTPTLTNIRIRNSSQNQTRTLSTGIELINVGNVIMENDSILGYSIGLNIETDENSSRATPTLTNIRIRNSSQNQTRDESYGLRMHGLIQPNISDMEISDYAKAVYLVQTDPGSRATPTLTNIRIRNSSQNQTRLGNLGFYFNGNIDAVLDSIDIEEVTEGIVFQNDFEDSRATPTLTNIRIRNSSQNQTRNLGTGLIFKGNQNSILNDIELESFGTGILFDNENPNGRATPTLTNIRIRNSSQNQTRTTDTALHVKGNISAEINDVLIEGYENGILYQEYTPDYRATPTLTNIRIRNSSQNQTRNTGTAISFLGNINAEMEDIEIEDYAQGLIIDGTDLDNRATPTLTNIRIRNSSQNQTRTDLFAIEMVDVGDFTAINDTIEGYTLGWKIENSGYQDRATPTLTNIRIRNSSQNQTRIGSVGFEINGDFDPQISRMLIENFDTGLVYNNLLSRDRATPTLTNIRIRNSSQNQTRQTQIGLDIKTDQNIVVENNEIDSCLIAIRLSGNNQSQIRQNLITESFTAVEINDASPFIHHNLMKLSNNQLTNLPAVKLNQSENSLVYNNNIIRYNTALNSQSSDGVFTNNLIWGSAEVHTHLIEENSEVEVSYNLMDVMGGSNIYYNPLFVDYANDNFNLAANSPCIDTGNPHFIHNVEPDSSISDIGMNYFDHPFLEFGDLNFVEDEDTEIEFELSQYLTNINSHNFEYFAVEDDTLSVEINESTATITPLANWFGSHQIVIGLQASNGYRDSVAIPVILNNVNDLPVNLIPFEEITLEEDFENYQYPTPLDSIFFDSDSDLQFVITSFDSTKISPEITDMNLVLNSLENVYTTSPTKIVITAHEMLATGTRLRTQRSPRSRVSLSDTLLVNISPVEDVPVAVSIDSLVFDEDVESVIEISQLFIDPDGDSLSVNLIENENVQFIQQNEHLVFTALANWYGSETIILEASDPDNNAIQRDLIVHVNPVNDAPEIEPVVLEFNEDDTLTFDLSDYVSDIDNDLSDLSYSLTNGENVAIYPVSDGDWNMNLRTVNENWFGSDSIQVTVDDGMQMISRNKRLNGSRSTVTKTFSVIVHPINDPPVLNLPDILDFSEDSVISFDISEYITDFDDEDFQIGFFGNDTINIVQNGNEFEFSAPLNWNGEEIVTFEVNDIANREVTQDQMIVRVNPVNDPPEIESAGFVFNEDDSLVVDFSQFVSDVDNQLSDFSYQLINGDYVTIEPVAENSWTMILRSSSENWFGNDSIKVIVDDGQTSQTRNRRLSRDRANAMATFNVEVVAVNDPPEIDLPELIDFPEDTTLDFDINEYISDVDNDVFEFSFSGNDSIQIIQNGDTFELSAPLNWNGQETIIFEINDLTERSVVQDEMIVRVNPVNDAPVLILPEMIEYNEDETFVFNMAEYIYDIDNEISTISVNFGLTENFEITPIIDNMQFEVVPNSNWNGSEILTVTINDTPDSQVSRNRRLSMREEVSGTFTYVCLPVNDAPVVENLDVIEFNEDESIEIDLHDYVSDIDNDDEDLTLSISGNNIIEVTELVDDWNYEISSSQLNWYGEEQVVLTINDNAEITRNSRSHDRAITEHQFTIRCLPVNDAPHIAQEIEDIELDEDFSDYTLDISNVFNDPEDDILAYSVVFEEDEISVEIEGEELILSSIENWNGTTEVTLIADDNVATTRNRRKINNSRESEEISFNVIISAVNDAPVIDEFSPEETNFEISESGDYTFSVVASDVDNTELFYSWFVNGEDIDLNEAEHVVEISAEYNGDYLVEVVVSDGTLEVSQNWNVEIDITLNENIPEVTETKLHANYPNPFNPETNIKFDLLEKQNVKIEIYNSKGQRIKVLCDNEFDSGSHSLIWNGTNGSGKDVASGIYFIKMQGRKYKKLRKALLLK
jgi:hypothetical protein